MKTIIFTLMVLLTSSALVQSAPNQGEVRVSNDTLEVWHSDSENWTSPEHFFALELARLEGPTYGRVEQYPPYAAVSEWETLIDVLPDGRVCPMVFFHSRWRRLPDVLALDNRLRNYGGCGSVFEDS